ncbi:MAG: mycothiol S-conjugate amidase [Bacteroidota bacterium]
MILIRLSFLWLFSLSLTAQKNSSQIYSDLEKLGFLGSAMYVAAHPDDENTNLISYLANEKKAHTVYLSLTRGDGGQNLIGTEMRELLGLIRTRELLEARKIDGGHQFFTRANDFGYSKHPDETLEIWNQEEIQSDVIRAIRKWQPDIIINRFDHESAGKTHGHHTTSAMLSFDCFEKAADPNVFPEQLEKLTVWQPSRLFFNTSWWFFGSQEAFEKADKSDFIALDVGVFYPHLGYSNNEISAKSRSMHKSQGFGSTPTRGKSIEYLKILKGTLPKNEDLFEGINTTWSRIQDGEKIQNLHSQLLKDFDHTNPAGIVPGLIEIYKEIQTLTPGFWTEIKSEEVKKLIASCIGLYIEASAQTPSATPGQLIKINIEAINRSSVEILWENLKIYPGNTSVNKNQNLNPNESNKFTLDHLISDDTRLSTPYWLEKEGEIGLYEVEDPQLRGLPENPTSISAIFELWVEGVKLALDVPVNYKMTDPVEGEVKKPFEVLPPVTVQLSESNYLFPDSTPKPISVEVHAGKPNIEGTLKLEVPTGWNYEPKEIPYKIDLKGDSKKFNFLLIPSNEQSEGKVKPVAIFNGESYDATRITINYPHIPNQSILKNASAPVLRLDLKKAGNEIGYIMGAGDEIPDALTQIGYHVTILDEKSMEPEILKKFDAIVVGIRAYNTNDYLRFRQKHLLDYVYQGGNLIIQYNTSNNLIIPAEELAPFPLKLSRGRITDENSQVKMIHENHPALNFPNKIEYSDFNGWVQERGLYFPGEWSSEFSPLLSMNDPGESDLEGGILVAPYGKGFYVYSGISWFRQLPAGVPGAFRLFTNLLSLGKNDGK